MLYHFSMKSVRELNELYELYKEINETLQIVWNQQYCLIKDDLIKVGGDPWNIIMIINFMEHNFKEVKTVYSPKNCPGNLYVMVAQENYNKPKNKDEFFDFLKKISTHVEKKFKPGDKVNHQSFGSGVILEDKYASCRDTEVIFKSDTNLGIPKLNEDNPRTGWTVFETTDIVQIEHLTKITD